MASDVQSRGSAGGVPILEELTCRPVRSIITNLVTLALWQVRPINTSLTCPVRLPGRHLLSAWVIPLITDDSVGLRILARLKSLLAGRPNIDVTEDYWGGLRLMERMIGYDRAIVVDAICTGAAPGTIHYLTVDMVPTQTQCFCT